VKVQCLVGQAPDQIKSLEYEKDGAQDSPKTGCGSTWKNEKKKAPKSLKGGFCGLRGSAGAGGFPGVRGKLTLYSH